MIKIEMDQGWANLAKLMKDIEKRYLAYLRDISTRAARHGAKLVQNRAPSDTEFGMRYKSGLKVVGVRVRQVKEERLWNGPGFVHKLNDDKGEDARASAIVYVAKIQELRERDPERTLFTIKPKKNVKRKHPGLYVLMKYNPWTADTLPWVPPKGDMVIMYTVEKENVVQRVRKQKQRVLPKVIRKLQKKGIKLRQDRKPKGIESAQVMSDVAKMALRFEFGLGRRSKPHWKPMIRYFHKRGISEIAGAAHFLRTMTDPSYNGWKRPRQTKGNIAVSDVENFNDFQQRIS